MKTVKAKGKATGALALPRALALFEASYRALDYSPQTVAWYRERRNGFFEFLRREVNSEPTLRDFSTENFRFFILENTPTESITATPTKRRRTRLLPLPTSTVSIGRSAAFLPGSSKRSWSQRT